MAAGVMSGTVIDRPDVAAVDQTNILAGGSATIKSDVSGTTTFQ